MFSLYAGIPLEFFNGLTVPRAATRRILLVEDDPVYRSFMRSLLNSVAAGSTIETVKTAEAARNRIDEDPRYELIVADYMLEGNLTGTDLWDFCNVQCPKVPFLMVSGLPVEEVFSGLSRQDPKPAFLSKPFPPENGRRIIQTLLDEPWV